MPIFCQNPQPQTTPKPLGDHFQRPLRSLRLSVIDRCNLRCVYCMPRGKGSVRPVFLKPSEWLSFPDIIRVLKILSSLGVSKIRLTGGEPLLRPRLTALVSEISRLGLFSDLALTTNGVLLAEFASALRNAGLHRLTVSLDTLDAKRYRALTGGDGDLVKVLKGLRAAKKAGFTPIKINTVVQRTTPDEDILAMVRFCRAERNILRFIEFMDVGSTNHWQPDQVVPSAEIRTKITRHFPLVEDHGSFRGDVAQRFHFADGKGEIGFISSISQPFCHDCGRLRLAPDGKLYGCLYAEKGQDLKSSLQCGVSDDAIAEDIRDFWAQRDDCYAQSRTLYRALEEPRKKLEMYQIGG